MSNLTLEMTPMEMIKTLAAGNPGAAQALAQIFTFAPKVDPDSALQGIGPLLWLGEWGIYGSDIYVLWSDICGKDSAKTIAVIRAVQMGLFSQDTLKDAASRQDYSGRQMIPVEDLLERVQKILPSFNKN